MKIDKERTTAATANSLRHSLEIMLWKETALLLLLRLFTILSG